MDRPPPGKVEDLATLAKLDEQTLLDELKIRYGNNDIYVVYNLCYSFVRVNQIEGLLFVEIRMNIFNDLFLARLHEVRKSLWHTPGVVGVGVHTIKIGTYVGDILIAVNPFKDLGIYEHEHSNLYKLAKKMDHPPHIFAVADSAYQSILGHAGRSATNQCILISGESGAGTTESAKLIIKQLVELCHRNTQLEQQILQVNPLLEAFGNAQTNMNDNSSRFGKYIQLSFHNGHVMGAKISEYLLEKSRIVSQSTGEQSFHIFYYMFAGLTKEDQQHFSLHAVDRFRYISNGIKSSAGDRNLLKGRYEELINAMDLVGFTDEEQHDLFTMVACVLHLGNVTFEENENDASYIQDENPIHVVAKLLAIDSQELDGTLTSRVTITRGEHVQRHYSKHQAEDARDAVAKILYGRLFGWIVNKVNQLLAASEIVPLGEQREISILVIFGFEHCERNSFEQACINLANERLQFFFNEHVFKQEQEEYTRDGIDWKEIKFVDNQPLLDLFLAKPNGILSVLDEESTFPRATEASLVAKLNKHFEKLPYYQKSSSSTDTSLRLITMLDSMMKVPHFSHMVNLCVASDRLRQLATPQTPLDAMVTYDAYDWLEKNRDTLPHGVMEMLRSSKNELIQSIFKAEVTRTGSLAFQAHKSTRKTIYRRGHRPSLEAERKRKQTVGRQFKNSLQILMERMTSASPIFVRCLKPNHIKAPATFDDKYIRNQLLYTGILETTKIRREGFAVRPAFEEFVKRYKVILCDTKLAGTKQNCIKILKATGIKGWQVGKTKVFLKYYHLDQIADVLQRMGKSAIVLQRIAQGFLGRRKAERRRKIAQAQAENIQGLLTEIQLADQQQSALGKDKNIPQSFFGRADSVMAPPPVPCFPSTGISPDASTTTIATSLEYLEHSPGPKIVDFGTQAEDSDGSEFSDDEFVSVASTSHPGHKMASVQWFQETQATQIYDPNQENFIAEWFHGVITRRQSEHLLKYKPKGTFLIRVSESRFGYSLSFRYYIEDNTRVCIGIRVSNE